MGFLIFFPFIAAIIGIFIGLIFFIGMGLIIIGITGAGMNKIYFKEMKTKNNIFNSIFNTSSIILGITFIIFPLGCALYEIIHSLS